MVYVKTLKDIEINIDAGPNVPGVFSDDLKEVAREWVKELKEVGHHGEFYLVEPIHDPEASIEEKEGIYLDEDYEASDIRGAIVWIKHFFNLEDK